MTKEESKFQKVKAEIEELLELCNSTNDKATVQLLHEVQELLHISHQTFLGNALKSIKTKLQEREES